MSAVLARGTFARRFLALILLVALADALFWMNPQYGLAVIVFAFATTLAAAGCAARAPARPGALALILAAATAPVLASPGFIAFSFAVIGTAYVAAAMNETHPLSWAFLRRPPVVLRRMFWQIVPDLGDAFRQGWPAFSRAWGPARLIVWVMPVGLGGIFLTLFAVANPVIDAGLGAANPLTLLSLVSWDRAFNWVFFASAVWPFIALRPIAAKTQPVLVFDVAPGLFSILFSQPAILRALILFNALFALQTALDIFYLWIGAGNKLPLGLSYADYAHRGAYPLIFTALLAGAFAIVATNPGSEASSSPLIKKLVLTFIAQNVLLVISSILRLKIYVDAYDLTRLRLAALLWMCLVGLGLILIVARLFRHYSGAWLVKANVVAGAALLYICAFLNFSAIVAAYDVAHCAQVSGHGAPLDFDYVESLGPQAIPALRHFENSKLKIASPQDAYKKIASDAVGRLRLNAERDNDQPADWRGWNFWSWRLKRFLS